MTTYPNKLYNLARMTTATTGTGTITLGSNVSGFLTFAGAGVQDGDVVSYGIRDGSNSEAGTGTYASSGTTLTRNVVTSTNSNSPISLSGSAEVYVTALAGDLQNAITQTRGDNSTKQASTAYVDRATGAAGPLVSRNRVINGAMVIDQRFSGGVFGTSINGYVLDRWMVVQSVTGKLNGQQNAGAGSPPAGFSNYLGVISQSAYTVGSTDFYFIAQKIEGYNICDLAWGTASAESIALSFWVNSSLTGTFGGVIKNGGLDRSYPFTYTISSANTWTYISVSVPGDTSGTWPTNSSAGMYVQFGLGVGSTYSGAAGSWASANYVSVTGAVSVVGTNNATFYITGVQIEPGSVATPFERRNFGAEFALCQRYYSTKVLGCRFNATATQNNWFPFSWPVTMRASPTISVTAGTRNNISSISYIASDLNGGVIEAVSTGAGDTYALDEALTLSSEL